MDSCICPSRTVGSFSEDRPLGWDPVAEGNRAGDGMACNNSDRRLRLLPDDLGFDGDALPLRDL